MPDPQPPYARRLLASGEPPLAVSHAPAPPYQPPRQAAQPRLAGPPTLAQRRGEPSPPSAEPDYGYGFRYNSQDPKGQGFFGNLTRPDGAGFMGEYSIGDETGEFPSMVPTLSRDEVEHILTMREGDPMPPAISDKATAFAAQRRAAGLPVFARTGEQQTDLYPELPRAAVPEGRPQAPPMAVSHERQALTPPRQSAQPPLAALQKAETIGADPNADLLATLRGEPPASAPPREPTLRARTPTEAINDAVQRAYQWAADTLPGRVADALPLPLPKLADAAGSFDQPLPAVRSGDVPLIGADFPQAQKIIQSATPETLARLAEQFPAFASDLKRYHTGETLPPALGHLADALTQTDKPGVYALKPEVQARIAHFLELGKSATRQANWQGSTSDEILKAFANDTELADIWARMIGATSAGTGVPRNTEETVHGMRRYLMTGGKPFTEELLTKLKFGLPGSKYANMNHAQLQEILSGDKVEAFAQLMRDYDRIPLDRHAIYALGGILPSEGEAELARHLNPLRQYFGMLEDRPPKFRQGTNAMYDTVTKTEAYRRVEQAFADTLRALDPESPLKDVFAQMWEGVREHRGGKFQGGPIDLMQPRGLLEPGAMTDPKRMLRALKMTTGKEWTPAMLAALAALGAGQPEAPPADGAPASTDYTRPSAPPGRLAPPRMTPR